jgi:hypothetical protein
MAKCSGIDREDEEGEKEEGVKRDGVGQEAQQKSGRILPSSIYDILPSIPHPWPSGPILVLKLVMANWKPGGKKLK